MLRPSPRLSGRKNMRFVPIKTDDQLDLQGIHRVRDRLISRRTAVINQIRAFLLERGLIFAQTPAKLKSCHGRRAGERRGRPDTVDAQPHPHAVEMSGRQIEQQVEELDGQTGTDLRLPMPAAPVIRQIPRHRACRGDRYRRGDRQRCCFR